MKRFALGISATLTLAAGLAFASWSPVISAPERAAEATINSPPAALGQLLSATHQPAMSVVGGCLGTPVRLGTIDFASSSKTQASATTPFNDSGDGLAGKVLLLQPTQAVYILPGTSSSATAASATSVLLQANERVCFYMHPSYTHLAAIRSASDGNLLIWELLQ